MNLTEELRAASADPPPTSIDLDRIVAREDRRRARTRWLAAGCAVAVVATAATIVVRLVDAPLTDRPTQYVFSPDRLPGLADIPSVEKVWPDAVHRLPARLPDGAEYMVHAVIDKGRYLVGPARPAEHAPSPSVLDAGKDEVTVLAPQAAGGMTTVRVLMARLVGDQVVWMLEGSAAAGGGRRELWAVRLDGSQARRLARLAEGAAPRFGVVGDAVVWEQDARGTDAPTKPRTDMWRVPLSGGPAAPLPGGQGWTLANDGPWLTNQPNWSGSASRQTGTLRNAATDRVLTWTAHPDTHDLECGPTWCSGSSPDDKVTLQRLDGSDYQTLPYEGFLSPTQDGRLALGRLVGETVDAEVVWDRQTGRVGVTKRHDVKVSDPALPFGVPRFNFDTGTTDHDPRVRTWRTGGDLMVLDLPAIR